MRGGEEGSEGGGREVVGQGGKAGEGLWEERDGRRRERGGEGVSLYLLHVV